MIYHRYISEPSVGYRAAHGGTVETREITVQRTFTDFDDFWTTSLLSASIRPMVAAMASDRLELLKTEVRARLPADAAGARANAVKGRVPK